MSIKIHHGEPGSYKTSGAMSDDIIPILEKGRLIITNVRGFTRETVLENFPEYDETKINVQNIDTDDPKNRHLMARWFHWSPNGAFFLIDEAQMVFPKKWDKKYIDGLDYEGGEEKAFTDNRPHDWYTAWEKHRHYNWDFILTTPNIKKIRVDIRECAAGGFYHRDMTAVGLKGFYKESYHPAVDSASASNIVSTVTKKVNPDVFKLYQSTATDEFLHTSSGIKIWKDPKLLLASLVLVLALWYALSNFFGSNFNKTSVSNDSETLVASVEIPDKKVDTSVTVSRKVRPDDFGDVDDRKGVKSSGDVKLFDKKGNLNWGYTKKDFIPIYPMHPASAPIYSDVWKPVTFPKLSCLSNKIKCICHTQQSTYYYVPDKICRNYALNGYFDFTKPDKVANDSNQNYDLDQGVEVKPRHLLANNQSSRIGVIKDTPLGGRFNDKSGLSTSR